MSPRNSANLAKRGGSLKFRRSGKTNDSSIQVEDRNKTITSVKVIEPTYDFESLIDIYEIDTTAKRCIDIIALNVSRGGFNIIADEGENSADIDTAKTKVYDFFMNANPDEPLSKIINDLVVDLKSTGNAPLEISRGIDGKPARMYRIPVSTMRYMKGDSSAGFKTGQRFVMNPNSSGDEVYFNRYIAKQEDRNESNGYSIDLNGEGSKTNEVIWFKLSNPKDRWYGLSPSITLLKSYLIKKYVDEYNANEFEGGLLSKFAVIVKNGSLTSESINSITEYVQEIIDSKKWSSVPILSVKGQNADIKIEKLGGELKDGSYLDLKKETKQDVMTAFGVPPAMLGIMEDVNRSNGNVQEQQFYEKEVMPLQEMFEYVFTQMIKYDFEYPTLNFKFTVPNFDDKKIMAEIADIGLKNGTYSINQALEMQGYDSIDDEGASERFIHHNTLGLINVKDLANLSSDAIVDAQGAATGKTIVDNLLGIKEKYEAKIKRKEILTGTDDPDFKNDPYADVE